MREISANDVLGKQSIIKWLPVYLAQKRADKEKVNERSRSPAGRLSIKIRRHTCHFRMHIHLDSVGWVLDIV